MAAPEETTNLMDYLEKVGLGKAVSMCLTVRLGVGMMAELC